jgi:molybdopterin/thiamine biosynthesis adenylyltransferase
MLSPDRLARHARHIVLPEVGGAGQVALAGAHVVLVGLGGIGNPALQYLAAAGIGRLTLIDDDTIEHSNLQRQTLFTPAQLGQNKAQAAAAWVQSFDPALHTTAHPTRITRHNAASLLHGATLVLDGCDNFATRLAVSDAATAAHIPLTTAAVGRFSGQIANFAGHLPGQPCYRCFVGDAFDATDCDSCAADGVLGAFVGMVGTMAATHAIRAILSLAGIASPLADAQWGQLLLLDGLAPSLRSVRIPADPACAHASLGR